MKPSTWEQKTKPNQKESCDAPIPIRSATRGRWHASKGHTHLCPHSKPHKRGEGLWEGEQAVEGLYHQAVCPDLFFQMISRSSGLVTRLKE